MRALLADLVWKKDNKGGSKLDMIFNHNFKGEKFRPYLEVELLDENFESDENEEIIDAAITAFEEKEKVFLNSEINVIVDEDEIELYIEEKEIDVKESREKNSKLNSLIGVDMANGQFQFAAVDPYQLQKNKQMQRDKIEMLMRRNNIQPRFLHNVILNGLEEMKREFFMVMEGSGVPYHSQPYDPTKQNANVTPREELAILAGLLVDYLVDPKSVEDVLHSRSQNPQVRWREY